MNAELEMVLRLVLAAVLGGIIGYQRERSGKPAGFRTMILISLGAALFTVIGTFGFTGGDPGRVAAGIVTGVGFLGAGTIFHHRQIVEGLTTAAAMWVTAAIGLASGAGFYIIAPAAALLTFLVLILPHRGPPK